MHFNGFLALPPRSALAYRQMSHVIPFGQFLSAVENRMISTVRFQSLKERWGNYVRHCWVSVGCEHMERQDSLLTFPVFQFAAGFAVEEVEQVTRLRWRV